jgi:hypothetical protein
VPLRQRQEVQEVLRPKRGITATIIVGFWLTMMAILIYREAVLPRINAAQRLDLPLARQELWMGVYLASGERVGFISTRTNPEVRDGDEGLALLFTARFQLSLFERETRLFVQGRAWRSSREGLRNFEVTLRSGEHDMDIAGHVEGKLLKGTLKVAGAEMPFSYPVGGDLMLAIGMDTPGMNLPLLEPGEEVYVDSFDPTTMSMGKARIACTGRETIEVGGEEIETKRFETSIGGFTTRAWVANDTEIVRAETPFGFVLKKIRPSEAMLPADSDAERASLVRTMAIVPTGEPPRRGAASMRIRIGGVAPDRLPPEGPAQTRADANLYLLHKVTPPDTPYSGDLDETVRNAGFGTDPLLQADHPRIVAQAEEITRGVGDPWQKARNIYQWVYENIDKTPVISVPAALDVLRTRQGDCNEHTVLFVALARASGLPARMAIGVVWSEELGGFGYHAWPEVYAGRWIPMDPTLGEEIADATHLTLLYGSIDRWMQLLPYIGQLEIEVISVEGGDSEKIENGADNS